MVALDRDTGTPDPILQDPPREAWTTVRVFNDDCSEEDLLIPFRQPENDSLDAGIDLIHTLKLKYPEPSGFAKRILEELNIPQGRTRLNRRGSIQMVRESLTAASQIDETINRFHFQDTLRFELLILNSVRGCLSPFNKPEVSIPTDIRSTSNS